MWLEELLLICCKNGSTALKTYGPIRPLARHDNMKFNFLYVVLSFLSWSCQCAFGELDIYPGLNFGQPAKTHHGYYHRNTNGVPLLNNHPNYPWKEQQQPKVPLDYYLGDELKQEKELLEEFLESAHQDQPKQHELPFYFNSKTGFQDAFDEEQRQNQETQRINFRYPFPLNKQILGNVKSFPGSDEDLESAEIKYDQDDVELPNDNSGLSSYNSELPNDNSELPKDIYGLPNDNSELPKDIYGLPKDIYGLPKDIYGLPKDIYGLPKDNSELPKDNSELPKYSSELPNDRIKSQTYLNDEEDVNHSTTNNLPILEESSGTDDPTEFAYLPSDSRFFQKPSTTIKVDDGEQPSETISSNTNKDIHLTQRSEESQFRQDESGNDIFDGRRKNGHQVSVVAVNPSNPDSAGVYLVAVVAGISAAATVGLIAVGIGWYNLQKHVKNASDVEYPAYGVTGPNKDVSPSGDRRLAQSAQMYHYQHQKQQIIAMESRAAAGDRHGSVSEVDSDEENEEGDYTVYECPGLAPTGEMEVKNPLFQDDPTPAQVSPAKTPTTTKEEKK